MRARLDPAVRFGFRDALRRLEGDQRAIPRSRRWSLAWKPETTDAVPIFVADIRDTDEPDALKKVIEGEGIRGLAFIPLVRNGRVIGKFMTYYRSPHQFSEGETRLASTIARQLSLSLDRIMAEEQLRESEQRFRLMSEHAPVMIWVSDSAGKCLHLNRVLRSFWGWRKQPFATSTGRRPYTPTTPRQLAIGSGPQLRSGLL